MAVTIFRNVTKQTLTVFVGLPSARRVAPGETFAASDAVLVAAKKHPDGSVRKEAQTVADCYSKNKSFKAVTASDSTATPAGPRPTRTGRRGTTPPPISTDPPVKPEETAP